MPACLESPKPTGCTECGECAVPTGRCLDGETPTGIPSQLFCSGMQWSATMSQNTTPSPSTSTSLTALLQWSATTSKTTAAQHFHLMTEHSHADALSTGLGWVQLQLNWCYQPLQRLFIGPFHLPLCNLGFSPGRWLGWRTCLTAEVLPQTKFQNQFQKTLP